MTVTINRINPIEKLKRQRHNLILENLSLGTVSGHGAPFSYSFQRLSVVAWHCFSMKKDTLRFMSC